MAETKPNLSSPSSLLAVLSYEAQAETSTTLARIPPTPEMEAAKARRCHQAHIYGQTRRVMRVRTKGLFAFGLRDHQRNKHVPTKRTRPALLKRRYSIDINTQGWNEPLTPGTIERSNGQAIYGTTHPLSSTRKRKYEELELVTQSTPDLPFPTPLRYHDFNKWWRSEPPANDDVYLRLHTATMSNNEWYWITHTDGPEMWMRDNALDMALMVLSCNQHCKASMIGIASSVDAQICLFPDSDGKEEYAKRFHNERWIFMPINDGMIGVENDGINGHHWSVVALDRVHQVAHYYDSLFVDNDLYQNVAYRITTGMLRVLDEDLEDWIFRAEYNCPNQYLNNQCDFDGGACGPFVYSMIELAVDTIQRYQEDGIEDLCRLNLTREFPASFGEAWNSYDVRHEMQNYIAHAKRQVDTETLTALHDKSATADEDVELLTEPALRFDVPLRPLQSQPVQPADNADEDNDEDDDDEDKKDDANIENAVDEDNNDEANNNTTNSPPSPTSTLSSPALSLRTPTPPLNAQTSLSVGDAPRTSRTDDEHAVSTNENGADNAEDGGGIQPSSP